MTPIHARTSRPTLPQLHTTWRRIAIAVLLAAGCAASVACGDAPTAPSVLSPAAATDVAAEPKPEQGLIAYVSGSNDAPLKP